jgi:hypothetical protein
MSLSGLEFRLDTAREMLPRLIAPWVLDLGLSLEAVDIEEPLDAVDWRPGVLLRMAFSERACRYGGIIRQWFQVRLHEIDLGRMPCALVSTLPNVCVCAVKRRRFPVGAMVQGCTSRACNSTSGRMAALGQ